MGFQISRRATALVSLIAASVALTVPAGASAASLVLAGVDVPATTTTNTIAVTPQVTTTGDMACVYMRIANEDGTWPANGFGLNGCRTHQQVISAGNGIKGVFVQVQGAEHLSNDTYRAVVSNIVFVKFRKVASAPTVDEPRITAVRVDMPDPAKVNDPMSLPSERLPHVNFTTQNDAHCSLSGFQYRLTKDGPWLEIVNRTRPFVHFAPTPGVQDLYVQLLGTCTINGVETSGAHGNIFHSTVDVPDYTKPSPDPQPGSNMHGPIVLDSVEVPSTTNSRDLEFVQNYHGGEGCLSIRTASEDGNWGSWITCKTRNRTATSAGYGTKGLFVQIQGSNGTLSQIKFVKYQYVKSSGGDTSAPPQPVIDSHAPVVAKVAINTSNPSRSATVTISATDDVAVSQVRFANEDGVWGEWQNFKPTMNHLISAGSGYKGLFVQVRDASSKTSTIVYTKFTAH